MDEDNITASTSSNTSATIPDATQMKNNDTVDDGNIVQMAVDVTASSSNSSEAVTTNGSTTNGTTSNTTLCVGSDVGVVGEQFMQLAKTAKGAAAVQLVKEALEAPGLYVFAELLHMPNIKELLNNPEHSAYYRLMEVFAYGVYDDMLRASPPLPSLSQPMINKLRHLTIVTMASTNKTLQLDHLEKSLGLDSRRELEDLIIEAIYADVLHGKLDQRRSVLEVDYALGRDIKPEDLPNIAATLRAWSDSCTGLLGTLDTLVIRANAAKEASIRKSNCIDTEVTKIKGNMKRQTGGAGEGSTSEDGVSQTDSHRSDMDKKMPRFKKGASGQAGPSGMSKSSAKFWPKS